jgi:WD40 repeat protein
MGWLYEEHPGHEIEKAARQRHRRTVLFIAALGAFSAVASALALVALTQWREATRQGAEAERQGNEARRQSAAARTQLDLGHIERGRQLLWDGYPFQAAPYLAGAYSDGVEHRPLRILLALAARSLPYVEIEAGHELDRLAFSPDGASVLARDRDGQERTWDLRTGHVRPVPARPPSPAEIATIDGDSVLVHDPASGRVRCVLSRRSAGAEHAGAHETIALSGSPEHVELDVADDDRGRLVTTSRSVGDDSVFLTPGRVNAAAQVWDGARCTLLYTLFPEHGWDAVHSASFSGDGTRLVTTSEDTAQIWSLADGSSIAVLRGHQGAVHAAMLSDDGGLALTGGEDRTARLWDAATGRQLAALEGHKAAVVLVALSPDGTRAATATAAGTIRIWSAAHSLLIAERRACMYGATDDGGCYSSEPQPDPQLAVESALFPGQKGMVRNLGWSADRTLAVTASEDRTAWLWDAQRHRPLASFDHPDTVLRGRFEDSGRTLVTSTWDHAWTWDLPFEDRSPAAFARLLECYVPFTLKDEQLEPAPTSRCAHTFDDLPPVRGESRRGADALLAAGDAALRRRAFADAALDYEQAQKLDPREASSKRLAAATALQARAPSSPQVLFDAARTAFRDIHDPRAAFDLLSRAPPGDPAAALLRLELLLAMDRLDEVVAGAARARLDERDELRAIALDFVTWAALKLSGRSPRDERAAARRLLRSAQNHVELVPPAARTDLAALEHALDHGHHRHDEALAVGDVMRHVYLTPGDENFIELAKLLGLDWLER